MSLMDRGLDLANLTSTTNEEIAEFRDFYAKRFGYALPAFEVWLDNRPDVLKAYRLQAYQSTSAPWTALSMLHSYTIHGYEDGILYEVKNCQAYGLTKDQVLECLAVAFLHSGPRGMRFLATAASDYLRDYPEPSVTPNWPEGWAPDSEAFRSGLDFTNPELSPAELDMLRDWYQRTLGEVPGSVELLASHRPGVLKAYRCRWETALRYGLPKQMMPYLMLHFNMTRGNVEGVREAALLGAAFGMTEEQIVDAVVWGMGYGGGLDAVQGAHQVLRQILEQ